MSEKGVQAMREMAEFVNFCRQKTEKLARQMKGVDQYQHAYDMGKDYYLNGVSEFNCQFYLFRTRELTKQWERGVEDAKKEGARGKDVPIQRS